MFDCFLQWLVIVLLIITAVCTFLILLSLLLWLLYTCFCGDPQERHVERAAQKPLLEPVRTVVLETPPAAPAPLRAVDNGVGVVPLMAARNNTPPAPVEVEMQTLPPEISQTEETFTTGNQAREAARQFEKISRSTGTEEEDV